MSESRNKGLFPFRSTKEVDEIIADHGVVARKNHLNLLKFVCRMTVSFSVESLIYIY